MNSPWRKSSLKVSFDIKDKKKKFYDSDNVSEGEGPAVVNFKSSKIRRAAEEFLNSSNVEDDPPSPIKDGEKEEFEFPDPTDSLNKEVE